MVYRRRAGTPRPARGAAPIEAQIGNGIHRPELRVDTTPRPRGRGPVEATAPVRSAFLLSSPLRARAGAAPLKLQVAITGATRDRRDTPRPRRRGPR